MSFRENLKDEISYQGLLLKEVALEAGLKEGSLNNYLRENASIPSADVAVRIAKVLGVSVEYLVTGQKDSVPQYYVHYSADIRRLADKLSKMTAHDRRLATALINAIDEE